MLPIVLIRVTSIASAVVVILEASVAKPYPRVTLASPSTLSGLVVRTLSGGDGLSKVFCLVASSLGFSAASFRLSAPPLCKEDTVGLRNGRGDWPRLSTTG